MGRTSLGQQCCPGSVWVPVTESAAAANGHMTKDAVKEALQQGESTCTPRPRHVMHTACHSDFASDSTWWAGATAAIRRVHTPATL